MMTDPISDMLTRIRNAVAAGHRQVEIPFSKLKYRVATILAEEKFVEFVKESAVVGKPHLLIGLKYSQTGEGRIKHIARISRPGRRIYSKKQDLPRVLNGYGIAIVSTPAGIMTNKEAKKRGLGGEVICTVY